MKILIVTPYFYPAYVYGGPIEVSYRVGRAWVEDGHEVTVVTTNASGETVLSVPTNYPVPIAGMIVYYCKRFAFFALSIRMIFVLFRNIRKTDLVVLHFVYSFPTLPALLLCGIFGKQLMWRPHGALQRWSKTRKKGLKRVWNYTCKVLLPKNTRIIYTSEMEQEESEKTFNYSLSSIVPNGVDVPVEIVKKNDSNQLKLVFIGRLDKKKGLENLIMAMTRVESQGITLDIIGGGKVRYIRKIEKLIGELCLANRVFVRGAVSHDKLSGVFSGADILILPSYTENFGQVVAEALAHGVPVIASRGTPWSRLEEAGCGLWVDNDAKSLALAIEKMSIMNLPEMGRKGRAWMKSEYNWTTGARKIISFIAKQGV